MRVLILGVGGVGAMAAWHLAQAGHEVIGLERHRLDHDRGSSYGDSRIVRRVYPDSLYTSLMADSYLLWEQLNALYRMRGQGTALFHACGGIYFGPKGDPRIAAAQAALEECGVAYDLWTAADRPSHFPALTLQDDEVAIHEPSMGFALASESVRFAASLALGFGATIREETRVAGIEEAGSGVSVALENGEKIRGDRLLIAAGAWTQPLLATLGTTIPLTVTRQTYVYFDPASHPEDFAVGRLPVWIDAAANAYGFPSLGMGRAGGVKLGLHDRGVASAPETVDRIVSGEDRESARRYARRRFEHLSDRVVYEKVCLYTNTPDEDFVIDTVPGLPAVLVVSACSGHGFKFTPLLGSIAASLLTDITVPYDLSRFHLSRFSADKSRL